MGHRPGVKGGYFPVPPVDSASDMRAEMLSRHGRDGPRASKSTTTRWRSRQHELGIKFGTADADGRPHADLQVRRAQRRRTPTARRRPSCRSRSIGDNGSGMHVHQSIWKDGKPLFAGDKYADLSETALYYIGGIIKHAKALNAFTNPSTNSYKRLVPGFEAPVLLAYSARNRSASCRIPLRRRTRRRKRVEVRFPDPTAQPVPRLRGDADGRPRRHQEQDPSGRPDGQGPLRPAAGRAEGHPDGVRLAARGPRARSPPTTTSCWPATCSRRTRSRATSS
jgi:glutamine synthetase